MQLDAVGSASRASSLDSQSGTSPHQRRRYVRAMAGSVEKMATGMARPDVGALEGLRAIT